MKSIGKITILLVVITILFLAGCATLPGYYDTAVRGYGSPEGVAAKTAVTAIAPAFVGEPWVTILSHISALLVGGGAIAYRKKLIDTPVK